MSREPDEVQIRALSEADIEGVCALAREIWRAHYPGIITTAQIEYMLDERYRAEILRAELVRDDVWWDLLLRRSVPRGFASYFTTAQPGEMKLDKIYVHPDGQRQGYGGMLIERAVQRGRQIGCRRLILAVNKRNLSAIAAYHKHGFQIEQAVVKDIGSGFVMDDYIMARAL